MMRPDGKIDLTLKITEDTVLDDPEAVLPGDHQPAQPSNEVPVAEEGEIDYEKRALDAIMVFECGE